MDSEKEIHLLKRALERQKKARIQAEKILEDKSKELFDTALHLKQANNKLENLLTETTSQLDGGFVNIIDPYVVMDLNFNVVNMNKSARDFLGYDNTKETISLPKLVHKDFIQYTIESFQRLLEIGTLKNYRAKIILKDGSYKWIQINTSVIYDKNLKPIGAQGIIRDISQETEIKELLNEQKKQLDIIVENSPLGIVLTVDDKIIKSNTAFTNLLGYENAVLEEIKLSNISEPEDVEATEKQVAEMTAGLLDNFSTVKKYFKKDGSIILAKTNVSVVKNDKGEVEYQVSVIEDITKERKAEEQIKAEKDKYSGIIANMNLGLIEITIDDEIQMVNQCFCSMSGFTKEELIGKNAVDVLKLQNNKAVEEKTRKRLEGISDSYEIKISNKNGEIRDWLVSGAPRYNVEGKVVGSIGIHLDITDQKKLEEQKEQLLKELKISNDGLQEYAHIVSHDLKSPLRSISALATWTYEDYKDVLDEAGVQNLTLMQEKVAFMDKLIHGILEYSTAGSSQMSKAKVDLNTIITDIKDSIYIPEHVTVVVPEKLPLLNADSTKIHQLFQNIIGNAVVHIEKKEGVVKVLFTEQKEHWQFCIEDNGVGIPEKFHKKIFEIFQSIGDNERSTGIGLSIVKKIVDRYQGKVWIESELGEGTKFFFTLKKNIN
ncbi:PAS domain-containing sensor histidine kinase [Cellulophaga fucicola]|uniref:histidine kinase n=1 Tax=Cellulophaga fucicola TaxID=76595 RepID=A0A1K1Q4K9_9FLAO|nr:PAS domain-containing sensor histidine kinase [Cellulophaga fucicola]SFW54692.1 PAS domain S-box-containing protein [Cellulophaga fucicola]